MIIQLKLHALVVFLPSLSSWAHSQLCSLCQYLFGKSVICNNVGFPNIDILWPILPIQDLPLIKYLSSTSHVHRVGIQWWTRAKSLLPLAVLSPVRSSDVTLQDAKGFCSWALSQLWKRQEGNAPAEAWTMTHGCRERRGASITSSVI